jgi:hypothetical protein
MVNRSAPKPATAAVSSTRASAGQPRKPGSVRLIPPRGFAIILYFRDIPSAIRYVPSRIIEALKYMLHVVEVRFAADNFRELLLRVRGWLNTENARPSTFRYWFSEPDTIVRVNFETEEHARAFAEAFGGVLLA